MARNLFDELNGMENGQLDGFFSDAAKKVRKKTRKVRKAVKKITPKPLRKIHDKIEAEGRRMDRSGLTKKLAIAAAGVGLAFVGGPAIMAGMKSAGGIVAKGAGLAKAGIASAAKGAAWTTTAGTVAKEGLKYKAQKDQAKAMEQQEQAYAAQQAEAEEEAAEGLAAAMGETPEFREVVQRLRSEGYSDQEILQHWVESKTYYQNAVAAATDVVQPQIKQDYVHQGYNLEDAEDHSLVEAHEIATRGVDEAKKEIKKGDMSKLIIPALGVALMFMGNK